MILYVVIRYLWPSGAGAPERSPLLRVAGGGGFILLVVLFKMNKNMWRRRPRRLGAFPLERDMRTLGGLVSLRCALIQQKDQVEHVCLGWLNSCSSQFQSVPVMAAFLLPVAWFVAGCSGV